VRRAVATLLLGLVRQAAGAVLLLGLAGCARETPAPATARNLVLVTIDTLRADRLGCYGGSVATPNLDRIAAQGAMAPHASVAVPLTRPSHATILTGLLPAAHGLRDNVSPPLAASVPTLAEVLKRAGFRTAGFVSSVVLSAQSGLARGFDTYSDRFELGQDDARFLNSIQRRGDVPTAEAIRWLESQPDGRRFAWLHLYDPHDPYEPPEPWASRYPDHPYDGEVAFADDLVGRLDTALQRLGLQNDTLLVVTSDHGEGLGEHGETVHGFFVYETTLHVPLLLRGPGIRPGTRLGVVARSVDLFPTVLELLGVEGPTKGAGRSLAAPLRGGPSPGEAPAYAESLLPLLHYGWSDLRALREGRFKYIQAPRPELYDLDTDPGELTNLLEREPARAEAFRAELGRALQAEKAAVAAGGASVDADLLEKLGALGYLGAGSLPDSARTGADPKDRIGEFKVLNRLMREGLLKLRAGDYTGSVERLSELLRHGVDSFEAHYYLARALTGLKRHGEAAAHYAKAGERLPAFAATHLGLADSRIAQGDLPGALTALERGRTSCPKDPRLAERQAQVLRKLGRLPESIAAYQVALALAPRDGLLRVQLGEAFRDQGDLAGAGRLIREGIDLDPSQASFHNALGMVLGAAGDLPGAEKAFRAALERDPRDPQYAYNLGLALLRQGRRAQAAPLFRRTLELDPGFSEARERLAEPR
jgi:arylsulfatase A-like enzyme/Flp pilus assembly protein TadD